ncbi:MAG: DUF4145 domain-containing protein [Desulfobacteria bacterium]
MGDTDIVKVMCKDCANITNHEVIYSHNTSGDYDEVISWWQNYQIIKCKGCDTVSFRTIYADEADIDPETGKYQETEHLYPDPKERKPITGHDKFPVITKYIYIETIKAISNGLLIVSALGLRTIVESICIDQKVSGRDLKMKIDQLAQIGIIASRQAEFFHTQRYLGNVAAHEIKRPDPEELVSALDIVETMLKTIYILPSLHSEIRKP